jgi:SAM-dependent methyltransferase
MHKTSFDMMTRFRAHIPAGSKVLDVGGADVNGSYAPLFGDCQYTTLDFQGADINVTGYEWPIEDGAYDAVISGQALEHDPFFWVTFRNMARVLRPGGVLALIVPSTGPVHRHPVDCYRFNPDALPALAKWGKLTLLDTSWDHGSQWHDLGGVFSKPRPKKR